MNIKFLVVDDSPTMQRIVKNTLKRLGYKSYEVADDGQMALDILQTDSDINFLITDWNMPNVTGLELVQSIRGDSELTELPILMVTTRSVKKDIIEAMKAGVDNYIVKPFTPETLKEKIEAVLKKRG